MHSNHTRCVLDALTFGSLLGCPKKGESWQQIQERLGAGFVETIGNDSKYGLADRR